ncbi:MAG: hypothetical protein U5N85_08685 [Arcicella sp.]|nr:hypothetical protein [Arcicella sp.]
MKKIIFCLFTLVCLGSCSQKQPSEENADSLKITTNSKDSIATDETKKEILYLEDILQCVSLQGLEKKFGKENVKKDAIIETGEGQFNASKIFPDTDKEVEIYWKDGKDFKEIQDVMVRAKVADGGSLALKSPWVSREGLKIGMRLSEIVALNGKTFTMTGIGWDLGGTVVSWEGGKLAKKNVSVRFNDYSDNQGGLTEKEYNSITGEREFDTAHSVIQKLNPSVDQLDVSVAFEIDADLGKKLTKEVEKKQIPR